MAQLIPQTWYHGTFTLPQEGQQWHPFTHLGTREAAIEVLTDRYCLDGATGQPHLASFTVPKDLNLLDVADFDSPDPAVWIRRLRSDKRFFSSWDRAIPLYRQLKGNPKGVHPRFHGHLQKGRSRPRGVFMSKRRKFSAEFKRGAVE
ncbi:MAG: hypothetical protein RSP_05430 [Rhodanobacter sp.]